MAGAGEGTGAVLSAWISILHGTYSLLAVLTVSQPPSVLLRTSLSFVVRLHRLAAGAAAPRPIGTHGIAELYFERAYSEKLSTNLSTHGIAETR